MPVIDGVEVPSFGKYEVEWAYREMVRAPRMVLSVLTKKVSEHFDMSISAAIPFSEPAFARFCDRRDRETLRTYLSCVECFVCDGTGTITVGVDEDETDTFQCGQCRGTGMAYDDSLLYKLLGYPVKHVDG